MDLECRVTSITRPPSLRYSSSARQRNSWSKYGYMHAEVLPVPTAPMGQHLLVIKGGALLGAMGSVDAQVDRPQGGGKHTDHDRLSKACPAVAIGRR